MESVEQARLSHNMKVNDMISNVQGRLYTQDRLQKWYPDKEMACPLCESCLDSLNHLFFECPYSVKIWKELKVKADQEFLPNRYDDIINRMSNMKHDKNKRLFRSEKVDSKELTVNVINHVRLKLSSLIVKKFVQVLEVSKKWDVVMNEKKR
ncbi:reverse transcriptase domain, Reverse transcriptase zinc-binding domain protein [Artemisia annua]|uniref:Reverse transcriptase domain, Reverse transcriptase zinc-binding domain protein n=1 Tax=Artemisia annua TaxID=35608 RepID=A0A2U1L961_ARTAN|nr:reverse transcriptase domain, Reverse transcriptase zinc-binding domain protein [Artemisia annua]